MNYRVCQKKIRDNRDEIPIDGGFSDARRELRWRRI